MKLEMCKWNALGLLSAVLMLAACSSSNTAVTTVPNRVAVVDGESIASPVRDSVSAIYQGTPSEVRIADVAFALSVAALPSAAQDPATLPRPEIQQNFESAMNRLLGGEDVIEPGSLTLATTVNFAEPGEELNMRDVAVIVAALKLPLAERSAETLASTANALLGADTLQPDNLFTNISVLTADPPLVTTESGLQYRDWVVGSGEQVQVRQNVVAIDYIGRLDDENGAIFDSSYSRENSFVYCPGSGRVIDGWEEGIPGMNAGGKRSLTIPPELAYGEAGRPGIPPNSTLFFEVVVRGLRPLEPDERCQ
ncbi:MAG: FKBP-type peptidyl-prolyl cis-trans isomerase [Cyanobacteria bacterium P01_F01_bin.33]